MIDMTVDKMVRMLGLSSDEWDILTDNKGNEYFVIDDQDLIFYLGISVIEFRPATRKDHRNELYFFPDLSQHYYIQEIFLVEDFSKYKVYEGEIDVLYELAEARFGLHFEK